MSMFDGLWNNEKLLEKIASLDGEVQELDLQHKDLQADLAQKQSQLTFELVPHSERANHMSAIQATLKQMDLVLKQKAAKEARMKKIQERIQNRKQF